MKILFVVPYVPSLVRVRPYNLIRSLRDRGHQVDVVTLWTSEEERTEIEALKNEGFNVFAVQMPVWRSFYNCLKTLPSDVPLQAVYSWNPELAGLMQALVYQNLANHPYDLIHVEHLRGVNYGLDLSQVIGIEAKCASSPIPIIWDSVDCISHLFAQSAESSKKRINRWLTKFELERTRRYEGWLVGQFDKVLVTSSVDRKALLSLASDGVDEDSVSVLPNGVDLQYFRPDEAVKKKRLNLVITGKMSYHANISMTLHFTQEILPLIWAQNPEVNLTIVGKNPPREILELDTHPDVQVTGTVDDIRPYIQQAMVAVAPITYGAGIQNKILEAMACETPVVTYPQATAALEAEEGQDFLVGDNPTRFAESVLLLLNHKDKHAAVSISGRKYVEEHHHWYAIAGRLETIYQNTMTGLTLEKRGNSDQVP